MVAFAAVIAIARAGYVGAPFGYAAPIAHAPLAYAAPIAKVAAPIAIAKTVVADEYDPHPQYSYAYDVQVSFNESTNFKFD